MTHKRIKFFVENQVAHVILSRPDKRNAIDMEMFKQLDGIGKALRRKDDVRVVIVRGEGEDFCSGLDVKSVMSNPKHAAKLLWKWWPGNPNLAQRVCTNWRKLTVPVIMAIHGRCWGGGLQIALGGDFRIVSPDASLSVMENKWGLIPDMGGSLALRELLSADKAMMYAMTAKEIPAQEALDNNLVTEIAEDPVAAAEQLAAKLKHRSPDSIAAIKKLYQKFPHSSDAGLLARESLYQIKVLMGKNQRIATIRETKDPSRPYV